MNADKTSFDAKAATWDEEPRRVQLAKDLFHTIREAVPLESMMEALDFGCGTGLVTLQLSSCVGHVTGVDSSQGMLDVMTRKIRSSSTDNVTTRCMNLEVDGTLEGMYDIVVSTMTLHHVRDVKTLLEQFARILRNGGWLCLADLDPENGEFHDTNEGVFHFGFDRKELRNMLLDAGFEDVSDRTAAEITKPDANGRTRAFSVFLVTGRRMRAT